MAIEYCKVPLKKDGVPIYGNLDANIEHVFDPIEMFEDKIFTLSVGSSHSLIVDNASLEISTNGVDFIPVSSPFVDIQIMDVAKLITLKEWRAPWVRVKYEALRTPVEGALIRFDAVSCVKNVR